MKSKRTKALEIPKSVKLKVEERDGGCCIICGRPGSPNAHFIARSHGGLGIEENIVTLCYSCHRRYDQSVEREAIGSVIADYLRGHYADWDPINLIYRKE